MVKVYIIFKSERHKKQFGYLCIDTEQRIAFSVHLDTINQGFECQLAILPVI